MLEKTLESTLGNKEIKPILKEINPDYSLVGLMLKLKRQYSGHLMQRTLRDPDAVKSSGKEKEPTEDEVVGWHH